MSSRRGRKPFRLASGWSWSPKRRGARSLPPPPTPALPARNSRQLDLQPLFVREPGQQLELSRVWPPGGTELGSSRVSAPGRTERRHGSRIVASFGPGARKSGRRGLRAPECGAGRSKCVCREFRSAQKMRRSLTFWYRRLRRWSRDCTVVDRTTCDECQRQAPARWPATLLRGGVPRVTTRPGRPWTRQARVPISSDAGP